MNVRIESKTRTGLGLARVFLPLSGGMKTEGNRRLRPRPEATHSSLNSGIEDNPNVPQAICVTLTAHG